MRFSTRIVHHKNGKSTTKPVYPYSPEGDAWVWVMSQRRIAEQRGILAAAKGLRTMGYPLSVALTVLTGTEQQAVAEYMRHNWEVAEVAEEWRAMAEMSARTPTDPDSSLARLLRSKLGN